MNLSKCTHFPNHSRPRVVERLHLIEAHHIALLKYHIFSRLTDLRPSGPISISTIHKLSCTVACHMNTSEISYTLLLLFIIVIQFLITLITPRQWGSVWNSSKCDFNELIKLKKKDARLIVSVITGDLKWIISPFLWNVDQRKWNDSIQFPSSSYSLTLLYDFIILPQSYRACVRVPQ
jgi:hypothetical protein